MLITRQNIKSILPLKPLGWANAGYVVAMTALLFPTAAFLSASMTIFFPNAAMELTSGFTMENLVPLLFVLAVMPSICEELSFRGAILSASDGMKIGNAALLNGVLFGLVHMNPQQIPYATFLGVVFALFVLHTKSILSSILAHFMVNGPNVLMAVLVVELPDEVHEAAAANTDGSILPALIVLSVIASVCFLAFLYVYNQFKLHNLQRNSL